MASKAAGTIFINYRREDSNWNALAIYNELQKYFSRNQLFKDFNAIQPGDDFVESIGNALQRCDVLLVLIGDKWLNITDANGKRRLEDPDDFVRLEIAKALSRNIKVVPVMLDEVKMPLSAELPEPLQGLTRRQSIEIDPKRFEDDIRKLAEAIEKILGGYNPPPKPVPPTPDPDREPVINPSTKPDNNMVWAILSTIFCCQIFGIMAIVSASKVDTLYREGKHNEAVAAAASAKKQAMWAAIVAIAFWTIYFILVGVGAINQPAFEQSSY